MAKDPRKRQKQLQRRAAKRKSKHEELVKEKNLGLADRLAAATQYPILDCGATEDVWTEGIGWAWLSRQLPNGAVAYSVFLIDRYCLGVKNTLFGIASRFTYDSEFVGKLRREYHVRIMTPAAVRKLVECAVAYARDLGLAPHADYAKARRIFGDIDSAECLDDFEFGQDGKPYFFAGPHDSPQRCRQILGILANRCGIGNFHYTIPFQPGDELPAVLKTEKARLSGPDGSGEISEWPLDLRDPPQ